MELYNGDCMEVMKNIPDNSVDLICTDIPYEFTHHLGGGTRKLHKRAMKMRETIDFMANGIDYDSVFTEFMRINKIPNMIIFCSNMQIGKIINFFFQQNVKTDLLVWEKTNPAPLCNGKYIGDLEYIIYAHVKGSPFNNDVEFKYKKKCKVYPIVVSKDKIHPTQKPVALMNELVNLHSLENQVVIDPFMGSGSTEIACINLNRKFIGIEKDPTFFELAKKRINDAEQGIENKQLALF